MSNDTWAKTFLSIMANWRLWDTYWLGEIFQTHEIGPYGFVEYVMRNGADEGKVAYSIFVDDKPISLSVGSLEEAMVSAVAYKYEQNIMSSAPVYFMRMIGATEKQERNIPSVETT